MKKTLSILIALVLVMSLGITALAAVDTTGWKTEEETTITFYKDYTINGNTAEGLFPADTLEFESVPAEGNPSDANLTFEAFTAAAATENVVTVNLPEYDSVGIYNYTIKEKAGTTQGVTYDTEKEIAISVLVVYDYENKCLKVEEAGVTLPEDETEKDDTITNTYDLGNLTVEKTVKGNLGDKNKEFTIHVTFATEEGKTVQSDITYGDKTIEKGWTGETTVDIVLKDAESVEFNDIPAGVTYTVEEDESHLAAGEKPTQEELNGTEGYIVAYTDEEGTIVVGETAAAKVENTKETEINTGVILDYLPYVIGLLAVLAIAVFMIIRKRRYSED